MLLEIYLAKWKNYYDSQSFGMQKCQILETEKNIFFFIWQH